MKKSELIKKFNDISDSLDDTIDSLKEAGLAIAATQDDFKRVRAMVDDLPEDEAEIEEDD
jgi:hypothetical protein